MKRLLVVLFTSLSLNNCLIQRGCLYEKFFLYWVKLSLWRTYIGERYQLDKTGLKIRSLMNLLEDEACVKSF